MTQCNEISRDECPTHGIDFDIVQSLHGEYQCGRCRKPLVERAYVASDALLSDEAIEAGAAAVRGLLGGEWIKYKGGEGLASLAIKAAIAAALPGELK